MSKGFFATGDPLEFLLTAERWGIDRVVNIKIDSALYCIISPGIRGMMPLLPSLPTYLRGASTSSCPFPCCSAVCFLPFPKLCTRPARARRATCPPGSDILQQADFNYGGRRRSRRRFICRGLSLAVLRGKCSQAHVRGELGGIPSPFSSRITGRGGLVGPPPIWRPEET